MSIETASSPAIQSAAGSKWRLTKQTEIEEGNAPPDEAAGGDSNGEKATEEGVAAQAQSTACSTVTQSEAESPSKHPLSNAATTTTTLPSTTVPAFLMKGPPRILSNQSHSGGGGGFGVSGGVGSGVGPSLHDSVTTCSASVAATAAAMLRDAGPDGSYVDFGGIDTEEFIRNSLRNNPKDRLMLLQLEQELLQFISDKQHHYLKFPDMTSYHRMLVHRVAACFGLDHNVDQSGKAVIVNKTNSTRIPEFKFSMFIPSDQQSGDECQPVRLLQRERNRESSKDGGNMRMSNMTSPEGAQHRSIEERQVAYDRAKARIFNQAAQSSSPMEANDLMAAANGGAGGGGNQRDLWLQPHNGASRPWSSEESTTSSYGTDSGPFGIPQQQQQQHHVHQRQSLKTQGKSWSAGAAQQPMAPHFGQMRMPPDLGKSGAGGARGQGFGYGWPEKGMMADPSDQKQMQQLQQQLQHQHQLAMNQQHQQQQQQQQHQQQVMSSFQVGGEMQMMMHQPHQLLMYPASAFNMFECQMPLHGMQQLSLAESMSQQGQGQPHPLLAMPYPQVQSPQQTMGHVSAQQHAFDSHDAFPIMMAPTLMPSHNSPAAVMVRGAPPPNRVPAPSPLAPSLPMANSMMAAQMGHHPHRPMLAQLQQQQSPAVLPKMAAPLMAPTGPRWPSVPGRAPVRPTTQSSSSPRSQNRNRQSSGRGGGGGGGGGGRGGRHSGAMALDMRIQPLPFSQVRGALTRDLPPNATPQYVLAKCGAKWRLVSGDDAGQASTEADEKVAWLFATFDGEDKMADAQRRLASLKYKVNRVHELPADVAETIMAAAQR